MKVSLKKIITSMFACILFTVSMISSITVSAACQPKLYLLANNKQTYTAKPGETVTITYNVDSPANTWCATGVHINYDKRLAPKLDSNGNIAYKRGPVIAGFMIATSTAEGGKNINGSILPDNLNTFFVTTAAAGDSNDSDGVFLSFDVTVPSNAKSGDKFPIEFWFIKSDIFTDIKRDKATQEYAFANAKNCSIVIK